MRGLDLNSEETQGRVLMDGRKLALQTSGRRTAQVEISKCNNLAMGLCLGLSSRRNPVCLERIRRKRSCFMSKWFKTTRFGLLCCKRENFWWVDDSRLMLGQAALEKSAVMGL